jgi:hypothetical protein
MELHQYLILEIPFRELRKLFSPPEGVIWWS